MVSATFASRLSWSPDGQLLLAGNSFQGATHAGLVLHRERWEDQSEHMLMSGHSGERGRGRRRAVGSLLIATCCQLTTGCAAGPIAGAVVATAFNPRMFYSEPEGNGEPPELAALFALGSQDHGISAWRTDSGRPLAVGCSLFKAQVRRAEECAGGGVVL